MRISLMIFILAILIIVTLGAISSMIKEKVWLSLFLLVSFFGALNLSEMYHKYLQERKSE